MTKTRGKTPRVTTHAAKKNPPAVTPGKSLRPPDVPSDVTVVGVTPERTPDKNSVFLADEVTRLKAELAASTRKVLAREIIVEDLQNQVHLKSTELNRSKKEITVLERQSCENTAKKLFLHDSSSTIHAHVANFSVFAKPATDIQSNLRVQLAEEAPISTTLLTTEPSTFGRGGTIFLYVVTACIGLCLMY